MKNLKDTLEATSTYIMVNETFLKYMKESFTSDHIVCRILLERVFDENVEDYYKEAGAIIRKTVDSLDDEEICIIYNMIVAAVSKLCEEK